MQQDELDTLAAEAFEGFVVRKDLALKFKGQYPVPTYVGEFLLGRYCATTDEQEIAEGLEVVQKLMAERTVRAGEEELFKARAREMGHVKIIDLITARLDQKSDAFFATLPSLQLKDCRIDWDLIRSHERMLTGGFYAEIELEYDALIAEQKSGRPFGISSVRPIQMSTRDALKRLGEGRRSFTTEQWKWLLLRSAGLEPETFTPRQQDVLLLRMVPFVVRNYNAVELGPRGTGKSHLFQQVSPYSHLISGGKATVAQMFVNNASGQRGLVCQYDVVAFDEIGGVSFDQKDGVQIMKGYMESGEFSRGKESIRGDGGMVFLGNFDVDVEHQQRVSHLFGPLPKEMRDDTAFMDRIHAYIPGWDVPKMSGDLFTEHFALVSDFLAECWNQLRLRSTAHLWQPRVKFGGALSGRDVTAVSKTVDGLMKLLYPGDDMPMADEDLEWAVRLSMESRRRVKEQQKRIGAAEFRNTHFSYIMGEDGVEQFVATPEIQSEDSIGVDPLPPGQVWGISPGGQDEHPGLYRIEVNMNPGSGVKVINKPCPPPFQESIKFAEQNLIARAKELVGDRDPRHHEFMVQLRAFDAAKSGATLGVPALLALAGAVLERSLKGGLISVGGLNLGGTIEPVYSAVSVVELAIAKGASLVLLPVTARKQLNDLSDDMATKVDVLYYGDAKDALLKALTE
jgi:ATP-dependent Lon protease